MYAENTDVAPERSRAEIERVLTRYGASTFGYMVNDKGASVVFDARGRRVRFDLPLPDRNDKRFRLTPTGKARRPEAQHPAYEQEVRRRWRALALAVKAKLEAVATGIASFEEEFLAHILLPDGSSVGAWMLPQLRRAYETKAMPPLMLGPGEEPRRVGGDVVTP